jgi:mycofactocin system transcriptional regulator
VANAGRRGRPRGTSARALELIALRLFTEQGFEGTTVDQIATTAGVSRRTFFRYFDTKSDVLWGEFDAQVETIRGLLARTPDDLPIMEAVRRAVIGANHYRAEDVAELRTRISLLSSVPELVASAVIHYDAWERAVIDFVARRCGQPADSLYPLAAGHAVLAACRAAYERWAARADADVTVYLDAALRALTAGFRDDVLAAEPAPAPPARRARKLTPHAHGTSRSSSPVTSSGTSATAPARSAGAAGR